MHTQTHLLRSPKVALISAAALLLQLASLLPAAPAASPVRLLVVTGGHAFETNQFFQMFKGTAGLSVTAVTHPQAHAWFDTGHATRYDVLVFYDMWQPISEEAKANLQARLQEGKGLVALHHCLASYQDWDEYTKIIGGKYHLRKRTVNGVEVPGSTYKHDVHFRVHVVDPDHPITRGLEDFDILDETYGGFEVLPGVTPLLTTTEATSSPTVAWAQTHGAARVVCIQLGHDHFAYENPSYRRLLHQAILWAAPKK